MRRAVSALLLALSVAACAHQTPIEKAQQLVRMHREQEAVQTLRTHLDAHPDDLAARRLYVRVLAFAGDLEGAKREVDELQRRMPGDAVPWLELGHAFELAHRFDEALAAYDTATEVAPSDPKGPREAGMRCARWGEPEEARPRLEEAIRRGAHDAEIFHALGLVRLHLGDLDGAEEAYKNGLAQERDGTGPLENLLGLATVAVVRGDAAAALAAYDRLLDKRPKYAAGYLGRAWALAKLGRVDEAKKALDTAEELGAPRANVDKQRRDLR